MEREKARARTRDAMTRKARAGYVTGGRKFGYVNVEVPGPDGGALTSSGASTRPRRPWPSAFLS
jgi:DNA invertase Pin-like site-specific DNA recombinase